jgi:hypothetical protein
MLAPCSLGSIPLTQIRQHLASTYHVQAQFGIIDVCSYEPNLYQANLLEANRFETTL